VHAHENSGAERKGAERPITIEQGQEQSATYIVDDEASPQGPLVKMHNVDAVVEERNWKHI